MTVSPGFENSNHVASMPATISRKPQSRGSSGDSNCNHEQKFFREQQSSGGDDGCRNSAGFGNGNHVPRGDMTNEKNLKDATIKQRRQRLTAPHGER